MRDGSDLLGSVADVFGGLATWLSAVNVPIAATQSPGDLQQVGARFDARYVLHGWTESERNRLRLSVELNEAESGRVLWSDRVDRPMTMREALRTEAADRIGRAVGPVVLRRELDRLALEPPEALTAQDLALRAFEAIMRPRRAGFMAAAGVLTEAEAKGGVRAGARFAAVWWHLMAISQGWGGDLNQAAKVAAMVDQGDPAAAALFAYTQAAASGGDFAAAATALGKVLDRTPLCGTAGSLKALTLCWLDDGQAAIGHAETAREMPILGPERAWRDHVVALAHYVAGRYEDAVRWARVSATYHPGLAANVRVLAASLAVLGRLDEAQQVAAQVLIIDPGFGIGACRTIAIARGLPGRDGASVAAGGSAWLSDWTALRACWARAGAALRLVECDNSIAATYCYFEENTLKVSDLLDDGLMPIGSEG